MIGKWGEMILLRHDDDRDKIVGDISGKCVGIGDGDEHVLGAVHDGDWDLHACELCLKRSKLIEERQFFVDDLLSM